MTVRDCYNACLIELNKVLAPSLLLNDFIYLLNKNIQEYFNKKYTSFEKILQNTDDLRHLINQVTIEQGDNLHLNESVIYGMVWECKLPSDYVHILGCRAVFNIPTRKCKDCQTKIIGVNKLDTNLAPQVGMNWYMRPSHNRPYYLIININNTQGSSRSDVDSSFIEKDSIFDREPGKRYGNSTLPIMLIICGDDNKYLLKAIEIQYLQAPRYVTISRDLLNQIEDTTEVLEFSDYVCNEIIKQLVMLILENSKDERILTFTQVNASIPQN